MKTREEFNRWVFKPNNPITAHKKAGELSLMWEGWNHCQALNDKRIAELEEKLKVASEALIELHRCAIPMGELATITEKALDKMKG